MNLKGFYHWLILFGIGCRLATGLAAEVPGDRENFHVFLLMGQSNMAGYGELEPGDEKPVPGIFYLPTLGTNDLAWQPAHHPLHNRMGSDRFGLGLPFAIEYQKEHPGVKIGLIPMAYGGAPMDQLNKGSAVYADALKKAAFAQMAGVIKGVLWHQGESDTTTPEGANRYEAKLDALVADLRHDLGVPNLPFIAGNLAEFYGTSSEHNAPDRVVRINQVRAILRDLPQRVPHTAFVESTGLKSIDGHNVHFDRASYIEFGKRYAAALKQLLAQDAANERPDWLIHPAGYQAEISLSADKKDLTLSNGLTRRVLRLTPNAATVEYDNPGTGQSILRAVKPEAEITLDGKLWKIGGLIGQSCQNYLASAMLEKMTSSPDAYQFTGWEELPVEKRFDWQRHPEWLSSSPSWPVPGRHVVLHFAPPPTAGELPRVDVHYEIYNGIPVIAKWLCLTNTTGQTVRLDAFASELLATVETAPKIDEGWSRNQFYTGLVPRDQKVPDHPAFLRDLPEAPLDYLDRFMDLFVVTDYAMGGDMEPMKDAPGVHWKHDPDYKRTGIGYYRLFQPAMLECSPPFGPALDLAPGAKWESFRAFEMLRDGTDRERRGLAECRFWATFAPWSRENPIYMHITFSDPAKIHAAIDQCAEVGFEMMILSFGSGYNPESQNPKYQQSLKELAAYAKSKGVVLGGYSLLASRGGAPKDLCLAQATGKPAGDPIEGSHFGPSPCLDSEWGLNYFEQLREFYTFTGAGVLEHDGSYPGDTCAATNHPGHRDFYDSQWQQWTQIRDFYRWCCGHGIYLNVPDWHFLNGECKEPMGYVENNWSLPRADQQIITRQNIYDSTFIKGPTMGWMFVPLTQYHGGGPAATVEPLSEHLDHYETQLASLFGAGVQACYRGPRLYDTDATKAVVKKWVDFYKAHRAILDSDLIHLRRADGRDWDGWLHVNPADREKGLAMFYNPLAESIERRIRLPLYYTGLTGSAQLQREEGSTETVALRPDGSGDVTVKIPAHSRTWLIITAP